MNIEITVKKLKYGKKPLTCFSFSYLTHETYLPNYIDLYEGTKNTVFERITNNPRILISSLTHESLHQWLFENLDKNTSLDLENIDKDVLEENYIISLLTDE